MGMMNDVIYIILNANSTVNKIQLKQNLYSKDIQSTYELENC